MKILSIFTKLLLLLLLITVLLVTTNFGAKSLVIIINAISSNKLIINNLTGTLLNGIQADQLNYQSHDFKLTITNINCQWAINLKKRNLHINNLNIEQVVSTETANPAPNSNEQFTLPTLPNWLAINAPVAIQTIIINQYKDTPIIIKEISAQILFNQQQLQIIKGQAIINSYQLTSDLLIYTPPPFQSNISIVLKDTKGDQQYIFTLAGNLNDAAGTIIAAPYDQVNINITIKKISEKLQLELLWQQLNLTNPKYTLNPGKITISHDIQPALVYQKLLDIFFKEHPKAITKELNFNNNKLILEYNNSTMAANINLLIKDTIVAKGTLELNQITGDFRLEKLDNTFRLHQLNLYQGKEKSFIKGSYNQQLQINYFVNLQNTIFCKKIYGKGEIVRANDNLKIHGNLKILDFSLLGTKIKKLTLNSYYSPAKKTNTGTLKLQQLQSQQLQIDKLKIIANEQQQIKINTVINKHKVYALITKNLNNTLYNINKLLINLPNGNTWHNQQPIKIQYQNEKISIIDACLQNNQEKICFNGEYLDGNKLMIDLASNFNAKTLQLYYPTLPLQGLINASLSLQITDNIITSLNASASLVNSKMIINRTILPVRINLNAAKQVNGITINGKIDTKDYQLTSKITHNNLKLNLDSILNAPIKANITGKINNLELFNYWPQNINNLNGDIDFNTDITGNLKYPDINLAVKLNNGSVYLPNSNTRYNNIHARINSVDNKFLIEANINSTTGNLNITGSGNADLKNYNIVNGLISINSNSFQISNTNAMKIIVDNQLQLNINNNAIILNGNIDILSANINIPKINNVETAAEDIVLVNTNQTTFFNNIQYDIEIAIKNNAYLNIYGISGELMGKVKIINNDLFANAVFGNATIHNGKFNIFNNELEITTGRLNYAGEKITRPHIDLVASKKLVVNNNFGNDNIPDRVGITAKGIINNPEISMYSEPSWFAESDILSYLVLGESLSNAKQASRSLIISAFTLLQSNDYDNNIRKKLMNVSGIDQIDITSEYASIPKEEDDLTKDVELNRTTNLILGKNLNKYFTLQYHYNFSEEISLAKIIYHISKRWEIAVYGNGDRVGANLLHTVEFGF